MQQKSTHHVSFENEVKILTTVFGQPALRDQKNNSKKALLLSHVLP